MTPDEALAEARALGIRGENDIRRVAGALLQQRRAGIELGLRYAAERVRAVAVAIEDPVESILRGEFTIAPAPPGDVMRLAVVRTPR